MLPLEGIRILDITEAHVGPSATVLLGDMGADVIKVERLQGDRVRLWGKVVGFSGGGAVKQEGDIPAQFLAINRNKRSIAVDLKTDGGREIVLRLAETSDVFVQNMRPGAVEKLGLSYAEIAERNPRIIYASGSGWGLEGAEATKRAVDITGQARSGIMMQTGGPDRPIPCGPAVCDHLTGLYLSYAILAALLVRERTGIGQQVDASMLAAGIAVHSREMTQYLIDGGPVLNWRQLFGVFWNAFKTRDRWICIGGLGEQLWPDLCSVLGLEHLRDDPRFSTHQGRVDNEPELLPILQEAFLKKSGQACLEELEEIGVICAPVQTLDQVANDPQTIANQYITEMEYPGHGRVKVMTPPFRMSETPLQLRRPSPELGGHTREILLDLGYEPGEIDRLLAEKVCREPENKPGTP
jgi:crotonobetainyl-CoA:carnitine CoA-transferase CaiB-like acyl-CoA transferase